MTKSIVWFRQDLRLTDNPALFEAAKSADVIPVYIYDTSEENPWPLGGASKWWLHNSLKALIDSGVPLIIRKGKPLDEIKRLVKESKADSIHWNRCYEPYSIDRDKKIKSDLDIQTHSHNGSLLFEPWTIQNKQGNYFKVFTPFWKHCLAEAKPRDLYAKPDVSYAKDLPDSLDLEQLNLLPKKPNWAKDFSKYWTPGEHGAQDKFDTFLEDSIYDYKKGRDYPAMMKTSRLSPHLHFGEISPHQIWHTVQKMCDWDNNDVRHFISEVGWREFSYHLLYHFPKLPEAPFQEKFKNLPWEENDELLRAWEKGQTGYPIIDAGMRELWATGYMHNRVRMIVASFLTKHCLIPWQKGEKWFWDTLVDADLASNSASWQWVAGSGADAAPYFRIFNPVTQSQKFDEDGDYIRRWVPELKDMPTKHIHTPWESSISIQKEAKCIIGKDYPIPIMDLSTGRQRALEAYKDVSGKT